MFAGVPMKEFLMWSNCSNNCVFCWQKKLNKPETLLTEDEKIMAIDKVMSEINSLEFSDILIVGGEVYCPHSQAVNAKLAELFNQIANRIKNGQTRYMYANTNLLYNDLVNIDALMTAFDGIRDKLRLTTSFDLAGRFANDDAKQLFLNNLAKMYSDYQVSPCVNMILTSVFCDAVNTGQFNVSQFSDTYHLSFINPIPYIPTSQDDVLKATWQQIERTIYRIEETEPHFIQFYIDQMGMQVDRVLKEYRKDVDNFVRCDSADNVCGHNINYTHIFSSGECFVCKLKNIFDFPIADMSFIQNEMQMGHKIITVGDRCSYEVWANLKRPNVMIIDGRDSDTEYSDVLRMVREQNIKRTLCVHNPQTPESSTVDWVLRDLLPGITTDSGDVVQVIGEEDDAIFSCIRYAPADTTIIFGDGDTDCMRYKRIGENDGQ